jgi:dihydroflavonol-4-reductase
VTGSPSSRPAAEPPIRPAEPWLLTGATGFLGRHVLELLHAEPEPLSVLALVRNPDEWHRLDWTRGLSEVTLLRGDVTGAEPGGLATRRLGGVLHLAALVSNRPADAGAVLQVNLDGTLNMVRLAARHRCRMVFVSTSGTVGCFREPDRRADEDAPYCAAEVRRWPYYHSKVEAERTARALAAELGVDLVIVRPPVLLGPGDHRHRSSNHVRRLLAGKVPFVIRGGMHFADVRDVADALVRLMQLPVARPVYHLPGTQCTIEEFYRRVAELAGVPPPRGVIPFRLAWLAAKVLNGVGVHLLPEPALVEMASHYWGMRSRYAEPELGYRNRPGDETLRDTIEWLRENPP